MTKKTKLTTLAALSLLLAFGLTIYFFTYQLLHKPIAEDKTEILFDVRPGATLRQVADELQRKNLIRNSKVFQIYMKGKGLATQLKVGEYALNQSLSPEAIAAIIISGKSVARSVTIAEGLNIFDIATIFEKNGIGSREEFLQLVSDRAFIRSLLNEDLISLEGYLFPETYKVTKFEGTRSVVTQMVKRFLTVWGDFEMQARQKNWSRNKVITFASIVEKETGASFERPLVSSVFHNRLHKGMRLQTDPTVLYGMAIKAGAMPGNITKNDLLTPTPYNSYTNAGLPPTPIANPGKAAIEAALNPAQSEYIYFVSKNDGTHVFSETLEQHNRAVREYQLNAKARENKSWRDLKEKENQ